MNELPDDVTAAATPKDAAERLGRHLGLPGPAPLAATERALADPLYARALLATRKLPAVRDQILESAAAMRISAVETPTPSSRAAPSTAELVAKAAGAALKWGMEGLRHPEPWVLERRLAACTACEHRAAAPETLVYRGVKVVAGKDAKICALCHCLINTKAAIATERCPAQAPHDHALSRWGDPWVDPATLPGWPWR